MTLHIRIYTNFVLFLLDIHNNLSFRVVNCFELFNTTFEYLTIIWSVPFYMYLLLLNIKLSA